MSDLSDPVKMNVASVIKSLCFTLRSMECASVDKTSISITREVVEVYRLESSYPPNHVFRHYGEYVLRQQHHAHALFTCRTTLNNGGRGDLEEKNC